VFDKQTLKALATGVSYKQALYHKTGYTLPATVTFDQFNASSLNKSIHIFGGWVVGGLTDPNF